jgi:hypothetical protein
VRTWLLVLALAVAVAGVVLFVLAREEPARVTVAAHDAAATPVAQQAAAPVAVRADAAIDAPAPGPPAELETLRSSGSASEPWIGQATNLLRGFDPAARVECYVAGCAAAIAFDSDDLYQQALETIRTDETWTGGKSWLPPERIDGKITAVLILYRPD